MEKLIFHRLLKNPLACLGLILLFLFIFFGIYAPLFAAGKPLLVLMDGEITFPLCNVLFYSGTYTKKLDLFFNIAMFTFPLLFFQKTRFFALILQFLFFGTLLLFPVKDPLFVAGHEKRFSHNFEELLPHLSNKEQQFLLFDALRNRSERSALAPYLSENEQASLTKEVPYTDKEFFYDWVSRQEKKIRVIIWPFFRSYHWEEDRELNPLIAKKLPFWELARPNQKDLTASLLFGIRIAITVGLVSEAIALLIAIPLGAFAGYFGGVFDLIVLRLVEIWESMPLFFMLLFLISILQTKSIFQVIFAIGLFSWTTAARYLRAEVFREKSLPYVETGRVMQFSTFYIIRKHILPNAMIPLLALVPFSILLSISAEAGLSFLGLGEENSPSWGVIMDEARQLFPEGIALLWPPAILLTLLLLSIALLGDGLRDAVDPKKEM